MDIASMLHIDEEEIMDWQIARLARWAAYVELRHKQTEAEQKRLSRIPEGPLPFGAKRRAR
jgi:hypothetical protein